MLSLGLWKAPWYSCPTQMIFFVCRSVASDSLLYQVALHIVSHEGSGHNSITLSKKCIDQLLGMPPSKLQKSLCVTDENVKEALCNMLVGQCALVHYSSDSEVDKIQLAGEWLTLLNYPPFSATKPFTPSSLDCTPRPVVSETSMYSAGALHSPVLNASVLDYPSQTSTPCSIHSRNMATTPSQDTSGNNSVELFSDSTSRELKATPQHIPEITFTPEIL